MTVHQLPTNGPAPSRFKLSTGDFMQDLPPLEWRIKDVLPARGLAAIYGPPSSGKSFLALDMACAIADGGSWFGHSVKPAPVVYVALEGEHGFPKRIKAWQKYNSRVFPADLYFVLDPFCLNAMKDIEELAEVCPTGCVLIIDTLNRASPNLDENSSKDMSTILSACKRLAFLTQGLLVLVHHTGKDETRGLRGHSSLLAALDASIEVSRSIDQRAWSIRKSKDDNDEVWHGFKLIVEQVGFDDDGDGITSCAVEPVGVTRTVAATHPQGKVQRMLLAPIQALIGSSGKSGQPGVPDEDVLSIPYDSAIQHAIELLPSDIASKHRATRAKDAIDGLIRRGLLNNTNGFIW